MPPLPHDVVILGGGPAGAALALALGAQGRSVALLERSDYTAPRWGETLPPEGRTLLARLGVWEAFSQQGHQRSAGSCSSWGSETLGYNDALYSPWGCGWHLDRGCFDRMLAEQAVARGVVLHTATELTGWARRDGGGYRLRVRRAGDAERWLEARFVVDATGRRAAFATAQGARWHTLDRTFCVAGVFQLTPGRTFDAFTLVEAREEGWWYSALLPRGRVVVGLVGDGASLPGVRPGRPEAWRALLARTGATRRKLAACDFTGEPLLARPAPVARLDRPWGEDWLAVGDAACTLDPLSSQGISQALRSALLAAEALRRHFRGVPDALPAYAATLTRQFEGHLQGRAAYYGLERRWPTAPFWSHRARVHETPLARAS
ncbi:tryptophan 7-halogenase [Archangium primigenium]|uniref:tryptophan 7-halogenase n=1 Tax=[Archangium] primigenium TaxID=2792470 RepID=UPI001959C89F|nr:NAD(P)/FAD-dependent oxidoreductase [Archangium primigenium]